VFRCGADGAVTFHNARWSELAGDAEPSCLLAVLHPDERDRVGGVLESLASDPTERTETLEARDAAGSRMLAVRLATIAGPAPHGRVVGSIEDISDTVQLRRDATHDPLTGALNRAGLEQHLSRVLRDGHGRWLLAFVDLDGFKAVNDRWGHDAGDMVLVDVARRLQRVLRPGDAVGRYGGDEFVAICKASPSLTPQAFAVRLEQALSGPIEAGTWSWRVRASIGTAVVGAGDDALAALRRADLAMFEVKRRHYDDDPSGSGARRGSRSREDVA
jgi:diguanylate cyclase (GGDEF)-like protein